MTTYVVCVWHKTFGYKWYHSSPDGLTCGHVTCSSLSNGPLHTVSLAQVLASAALVLIMTPGVAFFYGGMVKHKNVVATLLQNFICLGLVAICFTMLG